MLASLTLAATMLAAPVPKDGPTEPPKGPPPTLQYFKAEKGTITVTRAVTHAIPVQRQIEVTVVVMGQPVKETRTVTEYQTVMKMTPVPVEEKGTKFATIGGKELTYQEAAGRFQNGAVALVTSPGTPIDPAYLKPFKDDTLIVTLAPAARMGRVTLPAPAPVPAPIPVKK